MNTAGQEIISKSTTVEADMLRDKLATQNRRWESICNQVTDRRDRYLEALILSCFGFVQKYLKIEEKLKINV